MPSASALLRVCLKAFALATFIVHVASQTFALASSSFVDSNPRPKSYSPNGHFVTAFSSFSTFLNFLWLIKLLKKRHYDSDDAPLTPADEMQELIDFRRGEKMQCEEKEFDFLLVEHESHLPTTAACLPFYIFGNVSLALSSFVATYGHHQTAHLLVIVNLMFQYSSIYVLSKRPCCSAITPTNFLLHLVMKTNAGFGVMLIWKTSSILRKIQHPTIGESMNTVVIFLLMIIGAGPDPTLGLTLLFVLLSLMVPDSAIPSTTNASSAAWQLTFKMTAVAITFCLLTEFILSKRRNFPWLHGWTGLRSTDLF